MTPQELNKLYRRGFKTYLDKTVIGDKNKVYDNNWLKEIKKEGEGKTG